MPSFEHHEGWFGTATDIDDLKQAESLLKASEEQFRRAIEDAPIPVIMQAEDGEVLQISKAWTELTGSRLNDIPTFDAWLSRAYGPGADKVRRHMHDLFNGEVAMLDAEFDLKTVGDVDRHWLFSASAPGELRGGRRFIVGMVSDLTERRRAEERLSESNQQLRLIVENARDYAIIAMDMERRVTSWNVGAQSILGYAQEEAIGLVADVIFTPEDRAAGIPQHEAEQALANGRAADERWHLRQDGSRFWGSGVMMAMGDSDGAAIGLVKIFRDHTSERNSKLAMERARERLHAALQETENARDQAEAAGKAKDRFLAVLSHELRAPLTPVLIGAQVLARNKTLPPAVLETVAVIERNVRLQTHLIDDLLDVSRIMHGKMELSIEAMDLHAAIRGAIEVAQPDIEAKNQQLNVQLEAAEHRIRGDVQRLQQVFWNILKNASKFTPVKGAITVSSRNESDRVVVEVRDSGVGFAPETAERIFDVFEQGNRNITAQYGGLGLGLAIAEASVKAHGGSIRAASDGPGTGATFTLELPIASGE
jgi:two-component system CheB/CheR fusion protein